MAVNWTLQLPFARFSDGYVLFEFHWKRGLDEPTEMACGGIFLAGVSAAAAFLGPAAVVRADHTKPAAKMAQWKGEDEIFQE
jgi:hypothetical protein